MPDKLLTPRQVAERLGVSPKTVTRWADAGKITAVKTLGGHRRFWESEVERIVAECRLIPPLSNSEHPGPVGDDPAPDRSHGGDV